LSAPEGLCASCAYARTTLTTRGARYTRCLRAATDPEFEKYPRLPVLVCRGYEPRLVESGDSTEDY